MTLLGQRQLSFLIVLVAIIRPGALTSAHADAGGTARVALVDSSRLWAPGGITVYAAARARLDSERSKFTVAERPSGMAPPVDIDITHLPAEQRAVLKQKLDEINRGRVRNEAWQAREAEVLDPIRAEVRRALDRYARERGIGLVFDRSRMSDDVLVAAPGVDITDAFIKDYNANAAKSPTRPPAK